MALSTFYLVAHKATPWNELIKYENHIMFKSPHLMDEESEAQRKDVNGNAKNQISWFIN